MPPRTITSRDNPLLTRVRKLGRDMAAYRELGQVWLEGEHLCDALRQRGGRAAHALISESAWQQPRLAELAGSAQDVALLPDRLFTALSALPSPQGIGFVFTLADVQASATAESIDPDLSSVVLDRLQDAGNVGSILRTAAALGVTQVLALKGSAGLWSPKVLRAGMGAHFGLRLIESLEEADLAPLRVPLIATDSQAGVWLHEADLPPAAAWVLGNEGQGVAPSLLSRCALTVRIPQPGGEQSLNVAAAAAIVLYESLRRLR